MNTDKPYTNLQEFAQLIAEALTNATGEQWTRSTKFDEMDSNWRALLVAPGEKSLFLSNTWASKGGRLYIGASFPEGTSNFQPIARPSITVADTKSNVQVANDIKRRLLPEYNTLLAIVLKRKAEADSFEANRLSLAEEVAKVVGGRIQGQMVYSKGWDLQVSGPDSIRFQGHCNYLTLDQLKKIQSVCPELFEGNQA